MKYLVLIACVSCVILSVNGSQDVADTPTSGEEIARNFIAEGRTFVHHAVKRMAFIMPAIFFKLGIAMTLLLLVTIVSVNNGFIGFMLLVVGMSSVLAKLQEARQQSPATQYVVAPPPHYGHFLDRSDTPNPQASSSTFSSSASSYPYTDVVYNSRYH